MGLFYNSKRFYIALFYFAIFATVCWNVISCIQAEIGFVSNSENFRCLPAVIVVFHDMFTVSA